MYNITDGRFVLSVSYTKYGLGPFGRTRPGNITLHPNATFALGVSMHAGRYHEASKQLSHSREIMINVVRWSLIICFHIEEFGLGQDCPSPTYHYYPVI